MSESPDQEHTSPSPAEAQKAEKKRRLKRALGFVGVVAFVGVGFLLFGSKVPHEVKVQFDLPPTVRSAFAEIPRARVALVTATVADTAGSMVATINLPTRNGLEGPRTGPVMLRLKRGTYVVRARVKSFEATEVAMDGRLEVDGDEAIVELK